MKGSGELQALRAMVKTQGGWDKFWGKVGTYGFVKERKSEFKNLAPDDIIYTARPMIDGL